MQLSSEDSSLGVGLHLFDIGGVDCMRIRQRFPVLVAGEGNTHVHFPDVESVKL
jgi:hypothetical protein